MNTAMNSTLEEVKEAAKAAAVALGGAAVVASPQLVAKVLIGTNPTTRLTKSLVETKYKKGNFILCVEN